MTVVSDKTGYPVEMLEPDMGMDSDLGIDSIKRVEILSALQERLPGSPVIGPDQLGSLRTLGRCGGVSLGGPCSRKHRRRYGATGRFTGDADCGRTGSRHGHPQRYRPGGTGGGAPLLRALRRRNSGLPMTAPPCPATCATCWPTTGRTVRVLTVDQARESAAKADVAGLVIIAPQAGTDDEFLEQAFLLVKSAAAPLRRAAAAGGALLATVSRLDGRFGCDEQADLVDPLSGGLAGLTKTANQGMARDELQGH